MNVRRRCTGSTTVASWRVVDAQEARKIELAIQRSGCVPGDDDHDSCVAHTAKVKLRTSSRHPTSVLPHPAVDRRGQPNAMNEEKREISTERKSSSLEPKKERLYCQCWRQNAVLCRCLFGSLVRRHRAQFSQTTTLNQVRSQHGLRRYLSFLLPCRTVK